MIRDNTFKITIKNFNEGFSPLAAFNSLTEHGNSGQASAMVNVDVLAPDYITQGPGLADLTNGNQAGVVSELINFILDKAVSADATYGIGNTKLFKISSTTVASGGTPSWPRTITGMASGQSITDFKGNLYYFYNTVSAGDIGKYDLSTTFDDDWGSTVPTGAATLQNAPHPVATKEDVMVFGNGRYTGTYISSTNTLAPTKLDFGNDAQVADVCFNANQWLIAVNYGVSGANKNNSDIFLWGAAGTNSVLDDETSVGPQKIGFLYPIGGVVYVAYQDLTTTSGYKIGYISGRQLKAIGYFNGSLPTFAQKTMYRDTILFLSSGSIYSSGAMVETLPLQLSQFAGAGYTTPGALASPFGTPMVASTDGGSNFRLAKFSGYDINCSWRSVVIPLISGKMVGMIDDIVVLTKTLGTNAKCLLQFEYNQNSSNSGTAKQITGTGKRRHTFSGFGGMIEDFRVFLDWSSGNATNDCPIRQIQISGHWSEKG